LASTGVWTYKVNKTISKKKKILPEKSFEDKTKHLDVALTQRIPSDVVTPKTFTTF
jgi:hypothetical protein